MCGGGPLEQLQLSHPRIFFWFPFATPLLRNLSANGMPRPYAKATLMCPVCRAIWHTPRHAVDFKYW